MRNRKDPMSFNNPDFDENSGLIWANEDCH